MSKSNPQRPRFNVASPRCQRQTEMVVYFAGGLHLNLDLSTLNTGVRGCQPWWRVKSGWSFISQTPVPNEVPIGPASGGDILACQYAPHDPTTINDMRRRQRTCRHDQARLVTNALRTRGAPGKPKNGSLVSPAATCMG
mgnify:CR=1 FL=1